MSCVIPTDEDFHSVKILPYFGRDYPRPNRWGPSTLILGESHYMEDGEPGQPLPRQFTRDVLCEVLRGVRKPAFNFFTKIAGLFYGGRRPTDNERLEFWRSVAYYSYIQVCAGNAPRQRPTYEMWCAGQEPFKEVLRLLRPEFVLVIGGALAGHLKGLADSSGYVNLGDKQMPAWLFRHESGNAFGFRINHPSSPGWSYGEWEPWTHAALKQARGSSRQMWG